MKKMLMLIAATLAAACDLAFAGDAERNSSEAMNADVYQAERRVEGGVKVLFLGNSITLHGPCAAIGWTNNWGMAASDAAHDYVHLVTVGIERETGCKADVRIRNIYEFESNFANWKPAVQLAAEMKFAPDYLIVALGENVRDLQDEAQVQAYGKAFADLLGCFGRDGKMVPKTVVRGVFWRNPSKDAAMAAAAAKFGVSFVRTDFDSEPGMRAGTARFAHPGVAAHPGDQGMAATAGRILAALFPPKPVTGMRVKAGDRELKVEAARCSSMPVNIRWPGHQRELDQTEICSFVRFDFTGATSLAVTPGRPFTNVVVRPLAKKVAFRREGDSVRLDLREPGGYSVEFDGRHRNLHVFADQARDYSSIDRASPKVRYFGPGEHDAGVIRLSAGETLFLDEGAVVYGRVVAYDAPGIRIVGKGILDGSKIREEPVGIDPKLAEEQRRKGWAVANVKRHDAIRLRFCDDAEITGITIRDSQLYAVCPIYCNRLKVDGVKIVGNWRYNSDGIDLHNCSDAVIRNCFIRTFDDSICVKGNEYLLPEEAKVGAGVARSDIFENVLVEKCTVWNDWGRALEIGAETRAREIRNVTFRDCDVIWHTDPPLDVQNCDTAHVHDITFDDIRVEYDDDMPYLVYSESARDFKPGRKGEIKTLACVTIRYIAEYSPAGAENRGRNSDIVFRNIAIAAPRMPGATLLGLDAAHRSEGIVFENVTLNGKDVTGAFISKVETNAFATVKAHRN